MTTVLKAILLLPDPRRLQRPPSKLVVITKLLVVVLVVVEVLARVVERGRCDCLSSIIVVGI